MRIFLTLALIFMCTAAYAEGYILPRSFSIRKNDLPAVTEDKKVLDNLTPTDISLTNLVGNFEYDYASTLKSTLNALLQFNVIPVEYDSTRGQIRARLESGKELFILLLPSQEKMTHVRITPADGRYNISIELIDDIFKTIARSLYSGV